MREESRYALLDSSPQRRTAGIAHTDRRCAANRREAKTESGCPALRGASDKSNAAARPGPESATLLPPRTVAQRSPRPEPDPRKVRDAGGTLPAACPAVPACARGVSVEAARPEARAPQNGTLFEYAHHVGTTDSRVTCKQGTSRRGCSVCAEHREKKRRAAGTGAEDKLASPKAKTNHRNATPTIVWATATNQHATHNCLTTKRSRAGAERRRLILPPTGPSARRVQRGVRHGLGGQ